MEDILVKTVDGGVKVGEKIHEVNILQNLEMPEQQSNYLFLIHFNNFTNDSI